MTSQVIVHAGQRDVPVQVTIELPATADLVAVSPHATTGLVVVADPLGETASPLADQLTTDLLAQGIAVLRWEPACGHLIGIDFDRYLAQHAVSDLQTVIAAARRMMSIQFDRLLVHVIAIGSSAVPAACHQPDDPGTSMVLINPQLPCDVLQLAQHSTENEQIPVGLVETIAELDPLAALARHAPPCMIVAAAADTRAPIESVWSYRNALVNAGHPAALLTIPRADHLLAGDASIEFVSRCTTAFIAHHNAPNIASGYTP